MLVEGWTYPNLIPHNTLYLNHILYNRTHDTFVNAICSPYTRGGLTYVNQLGRYTLNAHHIIQHPTLVEPYTSILSVRVGRIV